MPEQDGGAFAQSEITAIAAIRSIDDLRALFRQRIISLGITYETAETIAGLPAGYIGKLLAPTPMRRFGSISLEALLGATGLKLLAVEDAEALARVKRRYVQRQRRLAQRAGPKGFVRTIDRKFMRKIGALGGFKTAQARHARALAKSAVSEMKRRAAFRRWRPEE
jgi:hypothetical protein